MVDSLINVWIVEEIDDEVYSYVRGVFSNKPGAEAFMEWLKKERGEGEQANYWGYSVREWPIRVGP